MVWQTWKPSLDVLVPCPTPPALQPRLLSMGLPPSQTHGLRSHKASYCPSLGVTSSIGGQKQSDALSSMHEPKMEILLTSANLLQVSHVAALSPSSPHSSQRTAGQRSPDFSAVGRRSQPSHDSFRYLLGRQGGFTPQGVLDRRRLASSRR